MQEPHFDPEPFGQRGVLPYVWPTFILLCAIGFCTSLLMLQRSWFVWDSILNDSGNRQVMVSSVIGRLVVTIAASGNRPDPNGSTWDFDSRTFESVQDGWRESWQKELGIEWGYEVNPQFNRGAAPFWRLRIRWRTLAVLYGLPIGIELARRGWRRYRAPVHHESLHASVT